MAWPLIEKVASAIQHAHDNGVVHADVNPSNIFITESKDVKLLDFGVSVEPITELSEDEWHVLHRALSYSRFCPSRRAQV